MLVYIESDSINGSTRAISDGHRCLSKLPRRVAPKLHTAQPASLDATRVKQRKRPLSLLLEAVLIFGGGCHLCCWQLWGALLVGVGGRCYECT